MYLLDTCVLSDFVKGDQSTQNKLKSCHPSMVSISTLTVMEIEYGLKRIPQRRQDIDHVLEPLYQAVRILPFCEHCAMTAAQLRFYLIQEGRPIGAYDYLIAATSLTHKFIMVTANLKEFERVRGLKVESWR